MTERLVVIGGGAGGLELVVKLARKLKRDTEVDVVLVDRNPTHIWKPLLHEVATGSLNSYHDETSYRMLARKHRFDFILGDVSSIDTNKRQISLNPVHDDNGREMVPQRQLEFAQLVICVGSLSNDFATPGVADHSLLLDSRAQAERFHENFIHQLHRVSASTNPEESLSVVIVGGGATGVELAADLHNVAARLAEFGFDEFSKQRLRVTVVEAASRLLSQLPQRIGDSVGEELQNIGVSVLTDTRVTGVEEGAVLVGDDQHLEADVSVWAAGIKAPAFLADSGLPTDRLGRVEVHTDLSVRGTTGVFAIGDCCACPLHADGVNDGADNTTDAAAARAVVPPRAQSAHQMASVAAYNVIAQRRGKPLKTFVYKDFGSLVSLSEYTTIGNLMGNLMRGTVFIEGWLARLFYLSLYRMHQTAVHGLFSTLLIMLGDRIYKATRAELKLH